MLIDNIKLRSDHCSKGLQRCAREDERLDLCCEQRLLLDELLVKR
jgi:hypothetical protein